ncbi:GINS complex subunit 3 [Strigomonas culicis]|uniref:GINS complex subunit 3 n=1 Tax=Strigomonas culicis TaxID=28005 RepID=S9WCB0_9TRYP|nr:GINS complex subunit 3 [Strigomonas culicis]EPY29016.1 GINS complex subunit 3 [Strigomonas culicis]EPY33660.1 GINS complex subunit 3 [Strigomonas culicis]|eukprot:EPY21062.1 GINS complex subunit 3 [Strigomonas culicis]
MIKSYFDLQDLGANEEPVPVVFAVPSFNLGQHIKVQGSGGEGPAGSEVKAGDSAVLPLWAATPLRRGGHVTVRTPTTYSLSTFREFKTDSLAPSLRLKSPFFYEAGLRVCRLVGNTTAAGHMGPEGNRLAGQLHLLYQKRYLRIIHAAAKRGFDLNDIRDKLTDSERSLLDGFLREREQEKGWYASSI